MKRTGLLQPLDRVAPATIQAGRAGPGPTSRYAGPSGPGERLDPATRRTMKGAFGQDFSAVRVHAGRDSDLTARALGADAFAAGADIGFRAGRYDPTSGRGRALLAQEFAHVVQQSGRRTRPATGGAAMPALSAVGAQVQRRVELRDVERGERSGIARQQEFVDWLNAVSTALVFTIDAAGVLACTENPYGTESEFDRKMKGFIDSGALLPLRLTNRRGRLGPVPGGPFVTPVDADASASGYVDVDDMLASDDLGFQVVLIHFLTERAATRNYARRIGTMDDTSPDFDSAHNRGVAAEVELLQDFFGDPAIRLRNDGGGADGVFRTYRNRRGDTIRVRIPPAPRGQPGLNAIVMDVRLRDGTIMTPEDYRDLLRREQEAAARRRLLELRGSPRVGPVP